MLLHRTTQCEPWVWAQHSWSSSLSLANLIPFGTGSILLLEIHCKFPSVHGTGHIARHHHCPFPSGSHIKQAVWRPLSLHCGHRLLPHSLASPRLSCQNNHEGPVDSASWSTFATKRRWNLQKHHFHFPILPLLFPEQTLGNQVFSALEKAISFMSS